MTIGGLNSEFYIRASHFQVAAVSKMVNLALVMINLIILNRIKLNDLFYLFNDSRVRFQTSIRTQEHNMFELLKSMVLKVQIDPVTEEAKDFFVITTIE